MKVRSNFANAMDRLSLGMDRLRNLISRATVTSACMVGVLLLSCDRAEARVLRIVVSQSAPWTSADKDYGQVGKYQRIQGLVYGELDASDPLNAIIQDINLAPKNANGKVDYVSTFTLYLPANMQKWSGILQYGVVNRGGAMTPTNFEGGDAFLENGWQGDIPMRELGTDGVPKETIQVPIAKNPDGSSITGPILARYINLPSGTKTLPIRSAIGYSQSGPAPLPVDLDPGHAKLTTKTFESVTGVSGPATVIGKDDWAWGNCSEQPFPGKPDPTMICLRQGFNPALLYQLEYTGKDPLVLGIGLAAIRDVASFFRYIAADSVGTFHCRRMCDATISQAHNTVVAKVDSTIRRRFVNPLPRRLPGSTRGDLQRNKDLPKEQHVFFPAIRTQNEISTGPYWRP